MTEPRIVSSHLPAARVELPMQHSSRGASGPNEVRRRWDKVVHDARSDQRLRHTLSYPIRPPNNHVTYSWGPHILETDLRGESQLMYARLLYLVTHVTGPLKEYKASYTVATISSILSERGLQLLWDAARDLVLADNLLAEAGYVEPSRWSLNRQSWVAVSCVLEVRSRVLYLVEILTLLFRLTLKGEAQERLQTPGFGVDQLAEVSIWLKAYVAKLEELEKPDEPQALAKKRRWSWRREDDN